MCVCILCEWTASLKGWGRLVWMSIFLKISIYHNNASKCKDKICIFSSREKYLNSQLEVPLTDFRRLTDTLAAAREQYRQVLISTMFFSRILCWCFGTKNNKANVSLKPKRFQLCNFWWKDIGEKSAHKMLMKLAPEWCLSLTLTQDKNIMTYFAYLKFTITY